jgi:hypothetical protein
MLATHCTSAAQPRTESALPQISSSAVMPALAVMRDSSSSSRWRGGCTSPRRSYSCTTDITQTEVTHQPRRRAGLFPRGPRLPGRLAQPFSWRSSAGGLLVSRTQRGATRSMAGSPSHGIMQIFHSSMLCMLFSVAMCGYCCRECWRTCRQAAGTQCSVGSQCAAGLCTSTRARRIKQGNPLEAQRGRCSCGLRIS